MNCFHQLRSIAQSDIRAYFLQTETYRITNHNKKTATFIEICISHKLRTIFKWLSIKYTIKTKYSSDMSCTRQRETPKCR